jgi:hypothetical protein
LTEKDDDPSTDPVRFSIPHRARLAQCVTAALIAGYGVWADWPYAVATDMVFLVFCVFVWFERQDIEIQGRVVTLSHHILVFRLGRARAVDTAAAGTRIVRSVLLPRRGLPKELRRIFFLRGTVVVARTKDLPLDVEHSLVAAINLQAVHHVETVYSSGAFRPK